MINPFASYVYAGYIQKCIGMKGGLVVNLKFALRSPDHIVVDLMGSKVPFRVSEYKESDARPVMFLEGKHDISSVEFLKQKSIYVEKDFINEEERQAVELEGYIVEDAGYGTVGEVLSIVSLPKQKLLNVKKGKEEVLLPFHPDLIEKIDQPNKILKMSLPEGFFD